MTFEEFWKRNRDRYLNLAKNTSFKLALHTAAEEAWDLAQSNTTTIESEIKSEIPETARINRG